jgi:hypothetical protein
MMVCVSMLAARIAGMSSTSVAINLVCPLGVTLDLPGVANHPQGKPFPSIELPPIDKSSRLSI